jgi:hypothetical protein
MKAELKRRRKMAEKIAIVALSLSGQSFLLIPKTAWATTATATTLSP